MKDYPLFVGKNCDAFKNFYEDEAQFSNMKDGRIPSVLSIKNGKNTLLRYAMRFELRAPLRSLEIDVIK